MKRARYLDRLMNEKRRLWKHAMGKGVYSRLELGTGSKKA